MNRLFERRLAHVSKHSPLFALTLRGYRAALSSGDAAVADGLAAWMAGQPSLAGAARDGNNWRPGSLILTALLSRCGSPPDSYRHSDVLSSPAINVQDLPVT
ncbi:DUF2791 family P-loop domain-containing protein [Actinoplanes bogorensis]|uniref:DUF2791 family P-loop domain-containing protein n=1 Tax=Paractinoplanes bogorensis TaxID=1610840 RepID=A0ABS5Z3A8_9ACTN|nr:DUF2791 family P-loop domain-containing protein [Actinoplanes bogorensis]